MRAARCEEAGMPLQRRRLFLAITVLASGVFLTLAQAQTPQVGSVDPNAPPPSSIRSFNAEGDRWAWVRDGAEPEAWVGGPSGSPRKLSPGVRPLEAVVSGSEVWVLGTQGNSGALVRLDAAGAASPVVPNLARPGGLLARGGRLFWIDARPAALSRLPFLLAGSSMWRVMAREADGRVRTLAEYPCSTFPEPGDVLDEYQGALLVRMHRKTSTEILRVPLDGGEPVRLLAEEGAQACRVIQGVLYWTAPSEEASPISNIRCIKRLSPAGKAELVAEWVPGPGTLADLGGKPAYLANSLYRLTDRLDLPTVERELPGHAVTDGRRLILLDGPNAPSLLK